MGYLFEISFDLRKKKNYTETKNTVKKCAYDHGCLYDYSNTEMQGKSRTIYRQHVIMSFFLDENEKECAKFIKKN